MVVLAF